MTKQELLIGKHPDNSHPYGKWLAANDLPDSYMKCHRELTEITAVDDELIEWMAKKIINHHYTQFRISRLKEKYKSLGFAKYAEQHRKLRRQYLRYQQAEIIYSISHKKLFELASDAGAIYRIDGTVLINRDIFDDYLERFHEPATGNDKEKKTDER